MTAIGNTQNTLRGTSWLKMNMTDNRQHLKKKKKKMKDTT